MLHFIPPCRRGAFSLPAGATATPAEERDIIDYIFVTGDMSVNAYTIVPEKRNNIYLSDHAPVYAEISEIQ